MWRKQTIEPQSARFAQRLRDRHVISPAGSDLARMVLAHHGEFTRAGTELPALIYHSLTRQLSEVEGVGRNGIDRKSQQTLVQSALSNAAATPLVMTRPGTMIQRRSLSAGSPADAGFSTREPQAMMRSPVLSDTLPFEESPAPVSLFGAGRFSASASPSRESTPSGPVARAAVVGFFGATLASPETPRPVVTLPESDNPNSKPPAGWPAPSEERSPPLFLFHAPAVALRKEAAQDDVTQTGSARRGSALPPIFGAILVMKTSGTKPGLVSSAKSGRARSEGSIGFAGFRSPILSEVHPSRPEAFNSGFLRRDIRMNPLGRSLPWEKEIASAAALSAPPLDLTLQLPKVSVAPEAAVSAVGPTPGRSLAEDQEVTARSMNSDMRPAVEPQVLSVPQVADRVYRLLERRLMIERERRGVFRT
jgi:hypothetical protein